MDLSDLLNQHEDGRFEAKLSTHGKIPNSLWQTYSSFANTDGGTILLGVAEDQRRNLSVVGVPNAHDLISMFWNNVNDGNTVSANILVDENVRVATIDDKEVVVIDVPRAVRSYRPVYTGKNPMTGSWRRRGEGDYRCTPDEVRAMLRDQGDDPLDKVVVAEIGLEAIDLPTLGAYRNMLKSQRPDHPWLELPDDEFLWKLGGAQRLQGDRKLHLTRAGLLMFGDERYITDEFPNYMLDFRLVTDARQRRWDDRVMSSDGTWPGNVFGFWLRVIPKLVDSLPTPFAIPDGVMRVDDTPLRKAVREAFVNALCHADYLGRTGVVVVRYGTERIELRNPGALRIELPLIERGGLSDARNPTILKMFNLLGIGERAGSGFDTMRSGVRSVGLSGLRLVEELNPDRVTLVLPIAARANAVGEIAGRHEVREGELLTEREMEILRLFGDGSVWKSAEVAERVGLSPQRARSLLSGLVSKGRLVRQGRSTNTAYRIASGA